MGILGEIVTLVDAITLLITTRKGLLAITTMKDILVVKVSSSYNAIIGHPKLNPFKAITLTYHLINEIPY